MYVYFTLWEKKQTLQKSGRHLLVNHFNYAIHIQTSCSKE